MGEFVVLSFFSELEAKLTASSSLLPVAAALSATAPTKIQPFLDEVFHNINSIFPKRTLLSFITLEPSSFVRLTRSPPPPFSDSRMVYRLQERQLESHPVIHSISDILIDSLFDLLVDYERYLKQ